MKKQLQIKREGEELVVMEARKKLFSISKDNSITGQDLYNSIFGSLSPDEKVEIDVTKIELSEQKDKVIFDRFKYLMDKICKAINDSNNKCEIKENEESDASSSLK